MTDLPDGSGGAALDRFHPHVAEWFRDAFGTPTPVQEQGWDAISSGEHALLLAPTGSGKTLASFLWSLDRLLTGPAPTSGGGVQLLYVSPLKALNADIERNLRVPLQGVRDTAAAGGGTVRDVRVAVRTGDTSTSTRASILRDPPDVLITTPESLYLMLTSPRARDILRPVRWVVVDEIHAVAASKRGTHLALSLERLAERSTVPGGFQRIGLSATARPADAIARLLGGHDADGTPRPVRVVDAAVPRAIDLRIETLWRNGDGAIDDPPEPLSPSVNAGVAFTEACNRIIDTIRAHRSTLVFAPARGTVEKLVDVVNELAADRFGDEYPDGLVRAHHGSVSQEQRRLVEEGLKSGTVPAVVCTSSLELGIDMGAIDCIVNYSSPQSVTSMLQRLGRAGHGVGRTSIGVVLARHPSDLLECAAVGEAVHDGVVEDTVVPELCLDVLAQHVVSMVAVEPRPLDGILTTVRRAAPYATLTDAQFRNVVTMLEGGYADERYSQLSPRVLVDAATGMVHGRRGVRLLATTNGGTIPDRGDFTVRIDTGAGAAAGDERGTGDDGGTDADDGDTGSGPRVGTLDEEFVGDVQRDRWPFILGASTWRAVRFDHSNVWVRPAPGEPGMLSFWNGERRGRGTQLGVRTAALARRIGTDLTTAGPDAAVQRLVRDCHLDADAATALVQHCARQHDAAGSVPSDRSVPVEVFRDEIGDLRIVIHSLFGFAVNGAWAHAVKPVLRDRYGNLDPQVTWTSDGVIVRLPDPDGELTDDDGADGIAAFVRDVTAGTVHELLIGELADAPMFALRFRESAQRALLLPRGSPARRTPLWLQRQRAADLLSIVRRKEGFPIVHEAVRECYQEVWDVEGLRSVLRGIEAGEIASPVVHTRSPSPFAVALEFQFFRDFGEAGDVPRGECNAAYLALHRDLLAEVLAVEDLRSLLDADVIDEVRAELGHRVPGRRARDSDSLLEVLVDCGDLSDDECAQRCEDDVDAAACIRTLAERGRVVRHDCGRWVAAADRERSVEHLALRHLDRNGPLAPSVVAARYDLDGDAVRALFAEAERNGTHSSGHYLPDGTEREWCRVDTLQRLHRRSLARARAAVQAMPLGHFVDAVAQHGLGTGVPSVRAALDTLCNTPVGAAVWEDAILPARLGRRDPDALDAACADGSFTWWATGRGVLAVSHHDRPAPGFTGTTVAGTDDDPVRTALCDVLRAGGAWNVRDLLAHPTLGAVPGLDAATVAAALEGLWWDGVVATDGIDAARSWLHTERTRHTAPHLVTAPGPRRAPGRWYLRRSAGDDRPFDATDPRVAAFTDAMLERYGVVTRAAVRAERSDVRWPLVWSELRRRSWRGEVVQGHFVDGLDGVQFARAVDVDRIRAHVVDDRPRLLAGADPANSWGRLLRPHADSVTGPHAADGPWRARAAGSVVVTVAGLPVLFGVRWGRHVWTAEPDAEPTVEVLQALAQLAVWRGRPLRVDRCNAEPVLGSSREPLFRAAGYRRRGAGWVVDAPVDTSRLAG